jgi:hypothetical protein
MCQKANQFLLREYIAARKSAPWLAGRCQATPMTLGGLFNIYLFERADGMRNPPAGARGIFIARRADPVLEFQEKTRLVCAHSFLADFADTEMNFVRSLLF